MTVFDVLFSDTLSQMTDERRDSVQGPKRNINFVPIREFNRVIFELS